MKVGIVSTLLAVSCASIGGCSTTANYLSACAPEEWRSAIGPLLTESLPASATQVDVSTADCDAANETSATFKSELSDSRSFAFVADHFGKRGWDVRGRCFIGEVDGVSTTITFYYQPTTTLSAVPHGVDYEQLHAC